jgi:hypothetical protein
MKKVLLVGIDPAKVDFSNPALPPGVTEEKIRAGIKVALADMVGRGWQSEVCYIDPDESAVSTLENQLASERYDCIVIGAGVRLPPGMLTLFEALINSIRCTAPEAAIAFNTRPDDSGAAAARWI